MGNMAIHFSLLKIVLKINNESMAFDRGGSYLRQGWVGGGGPDKRY